MQGVEELLQPRQRGLPNPDDSVEVDEEGSELCEIRHRQGASGVARQPANLRRRNSSTGMSMRPASKLVRSSKFSLPVNRRKTPRGGPSYSPANPPSE